MESNCEICGNKNICNKLIKNSDGTCYKFWIETDPSKGFSLIPEETLKSNTLSFNTEEEGIVGTFYFDTLEFEGNVKESARIFWEEVRMQGKTLYERIAELEEQPTNLSKPNESLKGLHLVTPI